MKKKGEEENAIVALCCSHVEHKQKHQGIKLVTDSPCIGLHKLLGLSLFMVASFFVVLSHTKGPQPNLLKLGILE